MSPLAKRTLLLILWAASLWGVLQLRRLLGDIGPEHGICGPWGCGPPLTALLAWHGFWFLLLAGPACAAIWTWPLVWTQRVGALALLLGMLGIGGVVIHEGITYLPTVAPGKPTYFTQRCMFALVTLVDLPILPVTLMGLVLWCVPSRNRSEKPLTCTASVVPES